MSYRVRCRECYSLSVALSGVVLSQLFSGWQGSATPGQLTATALHELPSISSHRPINEIFDSQADHPSHGQSQEKKTTAPLNNWLLMLIAPLEEIVDINQYDPLRIVEAISNQIPDSFPLLKPWYRVDISRMYGESFSKFSSNDFPMSTRRRVLPRWFLATYLRTYNTHI